MSGDFVIGALAVAPWLFGKMPAHGDFISRGLDDETVEAGDGAVAEAVALAMSHWDLAWDEVYVETPVWRFLAAPGVMGRDWLAGVFLPSVDAVGRQFPLLAGFAAPTLALLARWDATSRALDEVEALARAALLDGLSVDAVLGQLGEIGERLFGPAAAAQGDPVAVFAGDLLRQMEATPWGAQSLWWVAGGEERLTLEGALNGEALTRLFRRAPEPLAFEGEAFPAPEPDAAEVFADTPSDVPMSTDGEPAIDTAAAVADDAGAAAESSSHAPADAA